MRRWLTAGITGAVLAAAAPAHAATPIVLGKGPGGLFALDAAEGRATVVVGRPDGQNPFEVHRSNGRTTSVLGTFGVFKARDPAVVAWPGGAMVAWSRVITGGMEYSTAQVADGALGDSAVFATGTGPPRLTFVGEQPMVARADAVGNVVIGDQTLTTDGLERRHLPLDVAAINGVPLVLDLAQGAGSSALRVIGEDAPRAAVVSIGEREDLEGSIAADADRLYVGFLREAVAYLATAERRPGARWNIRRLPGPGGGEGAPAVARSGGFTFVAYGQGARRRDIYLARIGAESTRLTHLTSHPRDDTRPQIAPAEDGQVFVGWTRERRGAETGTALLLKTD